MTVFRPRLPIVPAAGSAKQFDVEPLIRIAEHRIRRAAGDEIRPLPGAARARQRARAIEAEHRAERHAGARREDAGQLPAGCQCRGRGPSVSLPNGSSHVALQTKLCRMSKSDSPLLQRRDRRRMAAGSCCRSRRCRPPASPGPRLARACRTPASPAPFLKRRLAPTTKPVVPGLRRP